jgi:ubiquinone/menaquinone biosynthesis C-methylase UbiE
MGKTVKINLGCGIHPVAGFTNVDLYSLEDLKRAEGALSGAVVKGTYIQADVRYLPFKDESADYILASEVIEHIPFREVYATLQEWIRVLKKGGRMVITCPDFTALAEQWLETPFSMDSYGELAQGIYGNQMAQGEFHQTPLSAKILQFYLSQLGLSAGKVHTIKRGAKMRGYPGKPARAGQAYRYGVIHCDVTK